MFCGKRIIAWSVVSPDVTNNPNYDPPQMALAIAKNMFPIIPPVIPYMIPMPIFSLSATKNFGIQAALDAGCDRIAVTDVDVAWTEDTLNKCLSVGDKEAIVPIYQMALDYETREEYSTTDKGCAGTVCMTADNWRRVKYDERYVGYGGEDGRLRKDIAAAAIRERRDCIVYHIAHDLTKPQVNVPGAGRGDCWDRDTINPDNWQRNKHLIHD